MKKYELTKESKTMENGKILYRIKYLKDIENGSIIIHNGDLGGFIESENNLSQEGNSVILIHAQ